MSIAELNGPSDREIAVLMMARCGGPVDGYLLRGLTHEGEIKLAARRLEARGLVRIEDRNTDDERIFLTLKGLHYSTEPEVRAA